jgi:hypothetical protein
MKERRKHHRSKALRSREDLKIGFEEAGVLIEIPATAKDASDASIAVEASCRIAVGTQVHVTGELVTEVGHRHYRNTIGRVTASTPIRGGLFLIAIVFEAEAPAGATHSQEPAAPFTEVSAQDYYEILQVNPIAEPETIHRVYRLLAQRFHPDNQDTGDLKQFTTLLEAYKVLSDPEKRAAYDIAREGTLRQRWKIFDGAESAIGREAEKRKRHGILSLLYTNRLMQPEQPTMTIPEIERLLGCPREHLEFPLWYLKESGYVQRGDNGRYAITLKGVDQAEQGPMVPETRLMTAAD